MKNIIEQFSGIKVLVIGDVMIDAYLFGKVDRISPEAPVPVVAVHHKENRLGGAANVAMNLSALGAKPILCSVIGDDKDGSDLLQLLEEHQIGVSGIVKSKNRVTTVKTRVISQNHQMLRIDSEITSALSDVDAYALTQRIINDLLPAADVVLFEDYDKGVLNEKIISDIIQAAHKLHIPVAVDPKKRNFLAYRSATLFKPNLKELKEGLGIHFNEKNLDEIKQAVLKLKQDMQLENVFVTLSEQGVLITDGTIFHHIPAHIRKIADVSGAGDTVISVASLCLALKTGNKILAELSNLAGGLVCEEVGVVPVDKNRFASEIAMLKL
jgi:rfaE bifunctional protein kinase chain/domain